MTSESDVDNWQLGRVNKIANNKQQELFVTDSVVITSETLLLLAHNGADESVLVRLTVEELDALIVLLRYRRSLIDDTPEPKEAT